MFHKFMNGIICSRAGGCCEKDVMASDIFSSSVFPCFRANGQAMDWAE